ncbi:hypothetical protein [Streptomyces chartreusis]|uniref:hypothetical protein n=1 Tax=Streptomyces chartreusis TaxID=1969 RepID=UPI00365DB0AE
MLDLRQALPQGLYWCDLVGESATLSSKTSKERPRLRKTSTAKTSRPSAALGNGTHTRTVPQHTAELPQPLMTTSTPQTWRHHQETDEAF